MQAQAERAEYWIPFEEPLRNTVTRTFTIAAMVATFALVRFGVFWPLGFIGALWFSFGGHWVELFFVNYLRFRLPHQWAIQAGMRLVVWFVGGVLLASGASLALRLLGSDRFPAIVWIGGPSFILVEFVVHTALALLRKPNFWKGDG